MARAWLLVLLLTLAQGVIWWLVMPPWTAPDEPGHYLYTRLLADLGRIPTRGDDSADTEAPIITSLAETDWWGYENRAVPHPLPSQLTDDTLLAASGVQIQDEPPLFYMAPAFFLRLWEAKGRIDPALALHWMRLWSLALRFVAVIAALYLAWRTWPARPELALGLGVLVGIMPMIGFIGGSLNNDALALAWGAVAFALLATASSPWSWLLTAVVVIAGPLLVDKGLLFLWPTTLVWALLKVQRLYDYRQSILTGFIILVVLLLIPNPRWAGGWEPYYALARNRSAENNLYLDNHRMRLSQVIAGKSVLALRGQTVLLEADFWGEPGSVLDLQVTDGQQTQQLSCEALTQQQKCELPFELGPRAFGIRVLAALGDHGHPADTADIHLHMRLLDGRGHNLLFNGDGHFAAALGSPLFAWLEHQLPVLDGFFARALSPAAWDAPAQFRYLLFAGFTWASFWGYFGWLSRPLPWWSYVLLAGLTFLVGWGLLQWGMAAIRRWRHRQASRTDRVLVLSLLAFFFILNQVWMPMLGQAWQPQGRYLFSALLPISVILYLGWENALPICWRPYLTPSLILGLISFNILAWRIVI